MFKVQYPADHLKKEGVNSKVAELSDEIQYIEQVKEFPQFKRYRRSDSGSENENQFRKIDVPRDGSCLFWSVTMAYLIPVRNNNALFQQRYEILFGNEETVTQNLGHIRDSIRNLSAANYDDKFANLVRSVFRNRVVDYIRNHDDDFRDFVEGESGLSFKDYLENMRKLNTWGGEPEIGAMSEMLSATISVSGATRRQYDNGDIQIQLFHVGAPGARNHYNFGLEQHVVDNDVELAKGLKRVMGKGRPQNFELIQLLIEEASAEVGTSQQGEDFKSFETRFQSFVDQIPSYLHSVEKAGFFTHFFLGSFSTLLDTEMAKKLDIKEIYFSFDGAKTLKVATIKNGKMKNQKDVIDKVKLFVISESGSHSYTQEFDKGELKEVLGNHYSLIENNLDKIKVKSIEIIKDTGYQEEIVVDVKDKGVDIEHDSEVRFKKVKKGIWKNPEGDIAKLADSDAQIVNESLKKILEKMNNVHSEYTDSLIYASRAREAAHHGFMVGVFMNFHYRYNLRVYPEQFAGRGYADIILLARGTNRALDSIPIIIELKAGAGPYATPDRALQQAEKYAKGFQPNVMRVLTTADEILYVGVNLDSSSPISNVVESSREGRIIPLFQDILKSADDWDTQEIGTRKLKEQIKNNMERIYHTFPGTSEKGDNHYFSRFLLGQSLLLSEDSETSFKKYVFIYENSIPTEVHPDSGRLRRPAAERARGALSTNLDASNAVVTMVLIPENTDKLVYVINIVEANRKDVLNRLDKVLPLNRLDREIGNMEIAELNLNFDTRYKSNFERYLTIWAEKYNSLQEYNNGADRFQGTFKEVPYPNELKETFDKALDAQSSSINEYNRLLEKIGEGIFPFKALVNKEAHFQGILHGVFSYYSDLKLQESPETRALVLTEFQTGRGERIDMLVHGIKFAAQGRNAEEYTPIGLELKASRQGKGAQALLKEANDQINEKYKEGVTYKTLTDGDEVKFIGVIFDKGSINQDKLILTSRTTKEGFIPVEVVHSSVHMLPTVGQCSKGKKRGSSSPGSSPNKKVRQERSLSIACIDSLDEEKITEKEKEQRIKELFGIDNTKDFNIEIEAYSSEIIAMDYKQVHAIIDNIEVYKTEVYVTVRDNSGNDKKLIIDDIAKMLRVESYKVVNNNGEDKIWLIDGSKHYVITEKIEGQNIEYYLNIDSYKVKLDSIIKDFTTDAEKKVLYDKLYHLSNEIELFENKKYIEDIGGAKDIELTNQDYDNVINGIKQNLLEKGVREDTFNQFKSHFDDLNEKVFAEYIGNVEKNLKEQGIEFDHNKFDSAKIKGAKSGKFFSLMAIYDLFDSIGDTATLGRYDNDALKQVFGINGILDAMDDVRISVSIPHTSKVGKLISKIPQPVRQTFVKIISNPIVQSITFATIAYQFGYSINEITQGNHHPLNYYWTISSGVKLASMGIRPISTGISFAIKSVSATTKILRGLSAAGKILSRAAVVTMVADILITIGVEIHERMEYTKTIAGQVPLLPGDEQAEVFFAKVIKFFTGRDVEKEYEDIIRVKGYLNHVKEVAIRLLDDNYNVAAVVQYVISIEEKYSEVVKTVEEKHVCAGRGLGCFDQWTCGLKKKYNNISFNEINGTSNVSNNLSSLNISEFLAMRSYTLVMNEGWERFICNVKSSSQCHQDIDQKEVYIVNTDAKHIPHLTKYEYEDLGLRIVNAPLKHPIQKSQCSNIINEERVFRPYALGRINMPCNAEKIHRNCHETFALSGEPFIFTNPTRKDPYHIRKETFPKGSVLYISGPKTLTAAANYPAVMYIPDGYVQYVGSKNNGTIFIINNLASGTLEGGIEKENIVVMNVKANNVVADLHNGTIHYGSTGDIKLAGIYNYVSNSDSKQNITTHCRTRLINAKNAEVQQNSFNCTDKDYEVRVVNKEDVHHRGLKQTIFIVNKDSGNAKIANNFNYTEEIKKNMDVIDAQVADITWLKVGKGIEGNGYSLDLLSDRTQNIVSSIKIDNFKNLVIQAKRLGIIESIIVQDKSLPDMVEDARYQKLNDLGKDIDREIIQNSEEKLKAIIQASILDLEWPNTYQAAKNIADNNNLGIPVSRIEVVKNYMGVPTEKTIIADMYSGQIVVDFGYNNSTFIVAETYYYYRVVCNYYQDITVEGRKGQNQYVVKLPEYNHILQQENLRPSIELDLNLKIKNKAALYQNVPDDIIDLTALNVTDVNSINMKKGRRSYFNKCDKRQISDLTVDSLEIKDVKVSISEGVRWSLSIGLVDYFRGPEYQSVILRINNKFYKINNANLKLEYVEANTKPFRYYQPDEQGLQIYHNQPINKNVIGLVDLKEKSILDFDIEIVDGGLLLSHKNNTITKVENWNAYQAARKMMFAFNDTIVSDSNCIAFTCNSEDIIATFNKAKETLLKKQLFNAIKQDNTNEVENLIRKVTDNVNTKDKHELISLHIAIQEGKLDVVKLLFNRGSVNVEDKDIYYYSPLHWAAQEGELGIAEFLVDKGVNTEDRNKDGKTPEDLANQKGYTYIVKFLKQVQLDRELLTAAGSGDLDKVKDLVRQGASLEAKNKNDLYYTPLHYASLKGHLKVVEYFIENGSDSKAKDLFGGTPVHVASLNGRLEVVKYFIENRADLETKDSSDRTLLHYASLNGHLDVVKFLAKNGADLEAKDNDGRTPLHYASLNDYIRVVDYLIKNWASLKAKDKDGNTSLDLANQKGYVNIVEFLKQAQLDRELLTAAKNSNLDKVKDLIKDGASLEAKDWHGRTSLHHASLNGNLDMVEYLIRQNVTLDVQNLYGSTPVHDASWSGHLKVVEYLIENKADFEVEDKYDRTPLHDASLSGHLNIVEYLVEKGAILEVKDKYDKTPLDLANQKGYVNIVEFLKQAQLDRGLFTAIQDSNHDKVEDLIKNGASLEAKNRDGKTPADLATQKGDIGIAKILKQAKLDRELFTAVQDGNLNKVKDLIKNGANLEARDKDGKTPLDLATPRDCINIQEIFKQVQLDRELLIAVESGNLNEVENLVVNKNADVNTNVDEYGWTPLHFAASGSKFDIVKFLFDKNANIKAKDAYGNTPLHIAAQHSGKLEIVEFLLDKNISGINDVTNDGLTPLHVAVKSNKLGTVKLLLDRGASIGIKDKHNRTPLSLAAKEGYINIVQVIEQTQLDLDEELLTAVESGNLNEVENLVEKGANFNAKNSDGKTPLDIAIDRGHDNIKEYLEKVSEERGKSVQRKRRHHHGDYNRHHNHLSSKLIDSSNQHEITASSGTRPSSWINSCIAWMKDSIGGFFTSNSYINGKNRVNKIDYSTNYEKQQTFNHKPQMTVLEMGDKYLAQADVNGTILLADVLLAKRGKRQIYTSSMDRDLSQSQTLSSTLNIGRVFEEAIKKAALKSGISERRLNIDFAEIEKMEKEINNKIARGRFDEISQVLKSYAEKACPITEKGSAGMLSPKKFNKFMAEFNNLSLDQSIQQILYNSKNNVLEGKGNSVQKQQRNSNLENKKPKSYLDNIATQGYLTQVRDLM
ncbi:MAG: ankyrin repeat domain-containing protein [Wolbachia endosymbiont of Xenopsylla cheopis]